jgi:exodeoxyribonuclease VII large subunit
MTAASPTRKVYGVAELTRKLKLIIEDEIGKVWLEGELSNVSRPSSGHLYFTLKDDEAQLRGALFKGNQRGLTCVPKDGMKVRVFGQLTVYPRSGQYQIIVQQMEEAGQGSLQAAFEALKKKLAAEGLFDAARKKPLPLLPQRIGIVTSPTGAAIRDMLNVLTRRFPNLHILLAPVKVQGDGAATEIAQAIDDFNRWDGGADVLIIGRGGGSLEDLWAFNEEPVARAIARSKLPVISAVGHETDFSISDFVADLRAPTPSAAAELVIGRKEDFEEQLAHTTRRLARSLHTFRLELKNRFNQCAGSWVFREPQNLVRQYRQKIDGEKRNLANALRGAIRERQQRVDEAGLHLKHRARTHQQDARNQLQQWQNQLRLLSPRAVLERGYSITRNAEGTILRDPAHVAPGEQLTTLLAAGEIISTVKQIQRKESHDHQGNP